MNALPNDTQQIARKHGKSYILSTKRIAFTIRGEHEEKCNVAKRFTVDIFTERDRVALLRKVVSESACYTCIYVFETKRRTTRFKVRKALSNKFVCVFITCKVYRNWMLIKFTTGIVACAKKIDHVPKVSENPR